MSCQSVSTTSPGSCVSCSDFASVGKLAWCCSVRLLALHTMGEHVGHPTGTTRTPMREMFYSENIDLLLDGLI
jgi:hypothetical protein